MTGRYPYHLGQQTSINMNPATTLPCGIHPEYDFIPKLLRDEAGYSTHALGKVRAQNRRRVLRLAGLTPVLDAVASGLLPAAVHPDAARLRHILRLLRRR